MKQATIRSLTYTLVLLAGVGVASSSFAAPKKKHKHKKVEAVEVTGAITSADVELAKHKISLIQTDPGYYYAGAAGALHRIHDVREQRKIIDAGERYPASTDVETEEETE